MRGSSQGRDELYTQWFKCTNCQGTSVAIDFKFCPDCGMPVETSEEDQRKAEITLLTKLVNKHGKLPSERKRKNKFNKINFIKKQIS